MAGAGVGAAVGEGRSGEAPTRAGSQAPVVRLFLAGGLIGLVLSVALFFVPRLALRPGILTLVPVTALAFAGILGLRYLRLETLTGAERAPIGRGRLFGLVSFEGLVNLGFGVIPATVATVALLARRGSRLASAAAIVLPLAVLDLSIVSALGVAALVIAVPDGNPAFLMRLLTISSGLAIAGALFVAFSFTPIARDLHGRFPLAWQRAELTPWGLSRAILRHWTGSTARVVGYSLAIWGLLFLVGLFALLVGTTSPSGEWIPVLAATGVVRSPILDVVPVLAAAFGNVTLASEVGAAFGILQVFILAAGAVAVLGWILTRLQGADRPRGWDPEDARCLRTDGAALAGILFCAAWVRLWFLSFPGRGYPLGHSDAATHWRWIEGVYAGQFPPRPPLYHVVGALTAAIGGHVGLILLNVSLSILIILVTYHVLRMTGIPLGARFAAGVVLAVFPQLTLLSLILTPDVTLALLSVLVVVASFPFLRKHARTRHGIVLGVVAGGAMLSKITGFVPVAVVGSAIFLVYRARPPAPAWVAGFVAVLIAAPWYAWNAFSKRSIAVGLGGGTDNYFAPASGRFTLANLQPSLESFRTFPDGTDFWGSILHTTFWKYYGTDLCTLPVLWIPPGTPTSHLLLGTLLGVALLVFMGIGWRPERRVDLVGVSAPLAGALIAVSLPFLPFVGASCPVRSLVMLLGAMASVLAILGAVRVILAGSTFERMLVALVLLMLAAHLYYYQKNPSLSVASGRFMFPALVAFPTLVWRGGGAVRSFARALRRTIAR